MEHLLSLLFGAQLLFLLMPVLAKARRTRRFIRWYLYEHGARPTRSARQTGKGRS